MSHSHMTGSRELHMVFDNPTEAVRIMNEVEEDLNIDRRSMRLRDILPEVLRILNFKKPKPLKIAALSLLKKAIDVNYQWVEWLFDIGGFQALMETFNSSNDTDILSLSLSILTSASGTVLVPIAHLLNYTHIIAVMKALEGVTKEDKIKILDFLVIISGRFVDDGLAAELNSFTDMLEDPDSEISKKTLRIVLNVLKKTDTESLSVRLIHVLLENLMAGKTIILLGLTSVSRRSFEVRRVIIESQKLDFMKLLFSDENMTFWHQRAVTNFVQSLYRSGAFLERGTVNADLYRDLSVRSQPAFLRALLERCIDPLELLRPLVFMTQRMYPFEMSDELVFVLERLVRFCWGSVNVNNMIVAVVVGFMLSAKPTSNITSSGLYGILRSKSANLSLPPGITKKFVDFGASLCQVSPQERMDLRNATFTDIAKMIRKKELSCIQFLANGGFERLSEILESDAEVADIQTVAEFLFFSLSPVYCFAIDETSLMQVSEWCNTPLNVAICYENLQEYVMIEPKESLTHIEGIILSKKGITSDVLKALMDAPGPQAELASYIAIHPDRPIPYAHIPIFAKLFYRNYKAVYFQNGRTGIHTVANLCGTQHRVIPLVSVSHTPFPKQIVVKSSNILFVANRLFERIDQYATRRSRFVHGLMNELTMGRRAVCRNAMVCRVAKDFPRLFSFDDRVTVFKLSILEPYLALMRLNREYFTMNRSGLVSCHREPLTLFAQRETIFEDGCLLLSKFMTNGLTVEVRFRGEDGIGTGPTKEFFIAMAHEFSKSRRRLFRNNGTNTEYCFDEQGLFPSVTASCTSFELLGILVAKALSMDINLDLNFNPAFLKLVRHKAVKCEEVDKRLALSLGHKDGLLGLDFTYPGSPEVLLVDQGDSIIVDSNNLDSYVELIKTTTLKQPQACAEAFYNGFNSVFAWEEMNLFSEEEMCHVISGDSGVITDGDLKKHVVISHGYSSSSPEIDMLFKTITEMTQEEQRDFLAFVTGSERLPIGGMKSLEPKMTIMKQDSDVQDQALPTASTCSCLLKLPSYSSKEILRSKLLQAMEESKSLFGLE